MDYIKTLNRAILEMEKAERKNIKRTFGTWNNKHTHSKIKQ